MARQRYKKNPDARTRRRSFLSMMMWGVKHGKKSGTYKPKGGQRFSL